MNWELTSDMTLEEADQLPSGDRRKVLLEFLSNCSNDKIAVRQNLLEWSMEQKLPHVNLGPARLNLDDSPSFTYWHSSIQSAPPIVKACVESQKKFFGNRHLILDDECLDRVISVPDSISVKRNNMTKTHYSDIIRLCLLAQYGGVWLDATVYMSGPLEDFLKSYDFFAYSRPHDPMVISSWFLVAKRSNYLITNWLALLVQYWRDFSFQIDYFLLHHLFEVLTITDSQFRKHWRTMPNRSFLHPHFLQSQLLKDFDTSIIAEANNQSSIHKLTYKYERSPTKNNSVADFLCANFEFD